MKITIYSKDNCPNCLKAITALGKHDPKVLKLGFDISRDDFFKKFPNAKTVPQIIIDSEVVGGYAELQRWIELQTFDEDF